MLARLFIPAAFTAVISAAACSKPSPSMNERPESTNARSRDIHLVDGAGSEPRVVSDIESGRTQVLPALRVGKSEHRVAPLEKSELDLITPTPARVTVISEQVPESAPVTLSATAMPALLGAGAAQGSEASAGDGAGSGSTDWSREPTVIIRGGAGSPRDDCKIHGAGARGGIAINSLAPPIRGQAPGYRVGQVRIR